MTLMVQSHVNSVPRLLPIVALAACSLVACGSSDNSETTTGGTTTGAAASSTAAATSAATSADSGGTATSAAGESTGGGATGDSVSMGDVSTQVGIGGADCWVVVDGTVYDATGNPNWKDGVHTPSGGKAACGRDLTEVIGQSPHGASVLEGLPKVGTVSNS